MVLRTRKEAIKGIYDDDAWIVSSHDIFKIAEECGGEYHITGLNNIHNCKEPVVFISNHMSSLETMIFHCIITPDRRLTFVMKESLVKHPFVGDVMRSRKPIVVGRRNPREDLQQVIEQGLENLKDGKSIVIFPQTTRKIIFNPGEFNSLGVKLAKKAGVKVIPVAIKTDFWANGRGLLIDMGPISRNKPVFIKFGAPIEIKGNGKEENQQVIDFIGENAKKWDNI